MHVPVNKVAILDCMPALFDYLREEDHAAVRTVLGHWILVYIHPYVAGNGHAEYYRRLSNIRSDGDWEAWIAFFLEGVATAAGDAERSIIAIATLLSTDRRRLLESPKGGTANYRLFEMLPMMPRFNIERVRKRLDTRLSDRKCSGQGPGGPGHRGGNDRTEEQSQLRLSGVR